MFKRTINKVNSRLDMDIFNSFENNLKIAFLELVLDCDNQGFYPKSERDFKILEKLFCKISGELKGE